MKPLNAAARHSAPQLAIQLASGVEREGIFWITSDKVIALASAFESGFAGDDGSDSAPRLLLEWPLPTVLAASTDNALWLLSRNTRLKPDSDALDFLGADCIAGKTGVMAVPKPNGRRKVGFHPTASGLYLIDGNKIHVLLGDAWAKPTENDPETLRIRADWRREDMAKTQPEPVRGLSYDEAYVELGVSANHRAACFAPAAKSK